MAELDHNRYVITFDSPGVDEDKHWQRSLGYLERMDELCRDRGIDFILATSPYGHQVATHEWAIGRYMWGISGRKVYGKRARCWAPGRAIAEWPSSRCSTLSSDRRTHPCSSHTMRHFTPNGHRLAASVLRDHLVARDHPLVEH